MRRVSLLGATGSIGTQTLDVLRAERETLTLVSASAATKVDALVAIAREFHLPRVAVATEQGATVARAALGATVEVLVGEAGLAALASDADVVVNAVLGFAGLPATLATLQAGGRLALANKESLIAAAPLVALVRDKGEIVPVDSEHCALHQCLATSTQSGHPDVARLWITASGGPFRGHTAEQLEHVTVADALAHPTWKMGAKITIDSSTLMNKGLEVLEARALFGVELDRVDVVVHPQSIVHSMVEYVDGSVIAQLATPDMRLPIAYALGLPVRLAHDWGRLSLSEPLSLSFAPPDRKAFPALDLAYEAGRRGDAAPAWLSAANEVAVAAFLAESIRWSDIVAVATSVLDAYDDAPITSLASLLDSDARARALAGAAVAKLRS